MSKKTATVSRLVGATQYIVITVNGDSIYTDIQINEMSVAKDLIKEMKTHIKTIEKELKNEKP